jgi:hypothetical protein
MNLSTKNILNFSTQFAVVIIFVAGVVFTLTIGGSIAALPEEPEPEEPEKSTLPQPAQNKIHPLRIPYTRPRPTPEPENRIIPSRRPNIPPVRVKPVPRFRLPSHI